MCTPQPPLLAQHGTLEGLAAARLPDGRIIRVGGRYEEASTEGTTQVREPPPPLQHGSPVGEATSRRWRYLPDTSVSHILGGTCVLSDGRFAVFGGHDNTFTRTTSREALTMNGDIERWDPIPPMLEPRNNFACAAVGECIIVAGDNCTTTTEVYEEALGRWRRLPCAIPYETSLVRFGSTLMT